MRAPSDMPPHRIKTVRQMYHLTQRNFAELLKIKYQTLCAWESGRRRPSSPAIALLKIAEEYPEFFREKHKDFFLLITQKCVRYI
jgi:putative transcriptional regulator